MLGEEILQKTAQISNHHDHGRRKSKLYKSCLWIGSSEVCIWLTNSVASELAAQLVSSLSFLAQNMFKKITEFTRFPISGVASWDLQSRTFGTSCPIEIESLTDSVVYTANTRFKTKAHYKYTQFTS